MRSLETRLEHAEREVASREPSRPVHLWFVAGYEPDLDIGVFLNRQTMHRVDQDAMNVIVRGGVGPNTPEAPYRILGVMRSDEAAT